MRGLDVEQVHSVIRVEYPDAQRECLIFEGRVSVYLFFGSDNCLIRLWVDEFFFYP
jgi:hypothetical protein